MVINMLKMAITSSQISDSSSFSTSVLHKDVIGQDPVVGESSNYMSSAQQSQVSSAQHSQISSSDSLVSSSVDFKSSSRDSSVLVLQSSLTSDIEPSSTVHLSSSPSMSSSRQPVLPSPSLSPTQPLTSIQESPYQTSNFKIPSQSSSLTGVSDLDSPVHVTSHISPSSSVTSSSSILPPILPNSGSTTTNGSASASPPSSLTDNLTLILGISLCGVALLVFVVVILFLCCRKRSKTKQQTVETVQIGDLWANDRQDISFAPTFDSMLDTVSESPKTNSKSSKNILYKVLYPFTAQDESQLNLDLGDIVTLIEKRSNGWWKGKVKDKEGWFPGSYVEEAELGLGYTPNLHLPNGHSPVSSFLKDQDITPKLTKNSSNRNSAPVFSFDKKVLGKEVSIPKLPPSASPYLSPHSSHPTSPGHSNVSYCHEKIITENVEGVRFHALYSHEATFSNELQLNVGDVVIGIEKDMNGWMKGKKLSTGEVGMLPAIYVQEILEETYPLGYHDKQSVYDQLPVSYSDMSTAEYIGVEHYAVCPYAAEIETDLSFDIGDTIIVCQTLDNGWWYGCHGDQFGWFPGSYVEMVEDEVDGYLTKEISQEGEITNEDLPENTVICDKPLETTIDKEIAALSPIKPHGGNKSEDEMSQKSTDSIDKKSKIPKSVPKASPNKKSKLPMAMRPNRPAPPPPGQHHSTPESKTNLMDKFNKTKDSNSKDKSVVKKPDVPKRYIKPKLRKVPKKKTKAGNESELCRRKVRSPPPPRPELPKVLREKYSINRNHVNSAQMLKNNSLPILPNSPNPDAINDPKLDKSEPAILEINDSANQSVVCDSSQNMTSFLENSVTTDTSLGKMSGLTSLSSSVQGERTQDQSELTNVSAFNVSEMNDSKQILIKQNSLDQSQLADDTGLVVQGQIFNDSFKNKNKDEQFESENNPSVLLDQRPVESNAQSKILHPKSYSMREESPKRTLIPKSHSLKTNLPKPPPVAPKPSKSSVTNYNSHYDDPGYSEVGAGLVGPDIVDGPEKFPLYRRPQSPIYSRIDKKYIVPNQNGAIQAASGRPFVEGNITRDLNGDHKALPESCVNPLSVLKQESDNDAQKSELVNGDKNGHKQDTYDVNDNQEVSDETNMMHDIIEQPEPLDDVLQNSGLGSQTQLDSLDEGVMQNSGPKSMIPSLQAQKHSDSLNEGSVQKSSPKSSRIPAFGSSKQSDPLDTGVVQNSSPKSSKIPGVGSQKPMNEKVVQNSSPKSSRIPGVGSPKHSDPLDNEVVQNSGPKSSMIPCPSSPQASSIPKRTMSPSVKNKHGSPNSAIPKPNINSIHSGSEEREDIVPETKSKPERPSRPPNVVRHSSLTSPSPSRLPKVEKSKSMRAESPSVVRKLQKPKQGSKDSSKIPSGIPKSPAVKQKAPAPPKSPHSGSRLPRKNGFVSPKPKRPPPPKSPPMSPSMEHADTINDDGKISIAYDGEQEKNEYSRSASGPLLKKTIASYTAQDEDELSFQEGCFITEISQDEKTGLCVGMLPNGKTGLYHKSYVSDSIEEQHSVV